mgnify:CR=1 FL=1
MDMKEESGREKKDGNTGKTETGEDNDARL